MREAVDRRYLLDWYINSVDGNDTPVWTEEHIDELVKDFDLCPKKKPALTEVIKGLEKITYKWEMCWTDEEITLTHEWVKYIYDAISVLKENALALKGGEQK